MSDFQLMGEHKFNGNCWKRSRRCTICGPDVSCDVCHEHDEPRGDCSGCSPCGACCDED